MSKDKEVQSTLERQTTLRQDKQVQWHAACGQARAILWDWEWVIIRACQVAGVFEGCDVGERRTM